MDEPTPGYEPSYTKIPQLSPGSAFLRGVVLPWVVLVGVMTAMGHPFCSAWLGLVLLWIPFVSWRSAAAVYFAGFACVGVVLLFTLVLFNLGRSMQGG